MGIIQFPLIELKRVVRYNRNYLEILKWDMRNGKLDLEMRSENFFISHLTSMSSFTLLTSHVYILRISKFKNDNYSSGISSDSLSPGNDS